MDLSRYHLDDLRRGYVDLVKLVSQEGRVVDVRGRTTYELTDVTIAFEDVTRPMLPVGVGRGVSTEFAALDTLDIIAGTAHLDLWDRCAPGWREVLVEPSDAAIRYAAYGPRVRDQLPRVVEQLRGSTTRSAIVQLWRPDDLTWFADRPCTIFWQFLLRDDHLDMHTHMRSQDVWRGTPYDVFSFTQLQQTIAFIVGVEPGTYTHHCGSLHIYVDDVEASTQLHQPNGDDPTLPRGFRAEVTWDQVADRARRILDDREYGDVPTRSDGSLAWYRERVRRVRDGR